MIKMKCCEYGPIGRFDQVIFPPISYKQLHLLNWSYFNMELLK